MKEKFSFHVSTMSIFWEKGLGKRYIAEPYVSHFYRLSESNDIVIAEFTRKNKSDYELASKYLNSKIKRYRSQLCLDLNTLHRTDYTEEFWIKALGLGFVRFVHILYDGYQIASQFNPEQHQAYLLDEESYYTCQDFEDFRQIFQNSNFGSEQMFSLYVKTFYLDLYKSNRIAAKYEPPHRGNPIVIKPSFFNRLKKLSVAKVVKKVSLILLNLRNPKVGVFYSYFSAENMDKLIFRSWGRVSNVKFSLNQRVSSEINNKNRGVIISQIECDDKFDVFYKAALESFFPTLYVESFKEQMSFFQQETSKHRELKYLISEAWIGNSRMSLFISLLQSQGVTHIYNEHNYMEHFLLGNHIDQIKLMCDQYYTIGWEDNNDSKVKKGASLFPFSIFEKNIVKTINYLYIGSLPLVKMAEINCAYGEQEENALRYMASLKLFFRSLEVSVKNELVYRPYPNNANWLAYDLTGVISPFLGEFKAVDDFKYEAKVQMLKSRLVIVDYLSTAYIEALIMNIPLIILFDPSRYFLNEEHENFFDDLIDAGICHNDANKAAVFINNMHDEIEFWWETKKVQDARKKFIKDNIGKPENAINYYCGLLS